MILINHPLPSKWDFNGHIVYYDRVKEMADKNNISFYDFTSLSILHYQNDFYDAHHLNQDGVEKFNQHIINVLPEFLPLIK